MLTMTVMQHERGAVEQFTTEPAEAEDVLSRLRHLHHTLQECHWRVQLVDHALCAQGDKGHCGLQNQTGNEHNFQIQDSKDCSLQNKPTENYSIKPEIRIDCNPQNEARKDQDIEEQFRETIDSKELFVADSLQNHLKKDQSCQNDITEETENQFCDDYSRQNLAEEKDFLPDITLEDQKLSVQDEDKDIQDLYNTSKNLDHITDDSDLSKLAINDLIQHNCAKKDNCIHNETKEENDTQSSVSRGLPGTGILGKKQNKYLTRQEYMDMDDGDLLPTDTMRFPHDTAVPNLDEISLISVTMTDISVQDLTLPNVNEMSSEKNLKQENLQESHYVGEVRFRPDSMQELKNKIRYGGDVEIHKNQKKNYVSQNHQQKSKKSVKHAGNLDPTDPSPEIAQKMDVIWKALENLQSHFHTLQSSLADSSNLYCSQEWEKSSDNSIGSVAMCGQLHTVLEDVTSETTQFHQIPSEQSLQRKRPVRNHHCICQTDDLSRNQISLHTPLEGACNSSALSSNSTDRRAYLQGCRESCLYIVMMVLLLLLFLFLASCLLLVLPVVSVNVRTAGGLPAF